MKEKMDRLEKCRIHNEIGADPDNWKDHVKKAADRLDVSAGERDKMMNDFGEHVEHNRKWKASLQTKIDEHRDKQRIVIPGE